MPVYSNQAPLIVKTGPAAIMGAKVKGSPHLFPSAETPYVAASPTRGKPIKPLAPNARGEPFEVT